MRWVVVMVAVLLLASPESASEPDAAGAIAQSLGGGAGPSHVLCGG